MRIEGRTWAIALTIATLGALAAPSGAFARAGTVTEFALSGPANANPYFIVTGPDGNLWFSLLSGHAIVRMTPAGATTVIPVPNPLVGGSQPEGMSVGPDGNVWFADEKCAVGYSTLSGAVTEYPEP